MSQLSSLLSPNLPQSNTGRLDATRSRLRVWSSTFAMVALLGWSFWTWTSTAPNIDRSGTPLGGDFLMFYTAGRMVQQDPRSLYDETKQQAVFLEVLPELEPGSCRLPYRYPPFVALLMAPISKLAYPLAFALFATLSVAAMYLTVKMFDRLESDLLGASSSGFGWWVMGWPIAMETILGGQQAFFGLTIATATLLLIQRGREGWAGMVLGLACYKPNLLLLFGLAMILRYPRMIGGVAISAAGLLAVQVAFVGTACLETYVLMARHLATEPWGLETPAGKVHGLAPWLALLWPGDERKILLVLGVLGAVGWAWWDRRAVADGDGGTRAVSFSWLILWNAICNPYLPIYDLLLLAIPTWLLFRVGEQRGRSTAALALFLGSMAIGPHLSQAVSHRTGFQLFPIALLALALLLGIRLARSLVVGGRWIAFGR